MLVLSLRKLMEACVKCRYFVFDGNFRTKAGAPMELSLSVVLADVYTEAFGEKLLSSVSPISSYWRYYVDCFLIWNHGDEAIREFLGKMNDVHPSIQFTMEKGEK